MRHRGTTDGGSSQLGEQPPRFQLIAHTSVYCMLLSPSLCMCVLPGLSWTPTIHPLEFNYSCKVTMPPLRAEEPTPPGLCFLAHRSRATLLLLWANIAMQISPYPHRQCLAQKREGSVEERCRCGRPSAVELTYFLLSARMLLALQSDVPRPAQDAHHPHGGIMFCNPTQPTALANQQKH